MRDHRKPCNIERHSHLPIYKAFIEHGLEHVSIELVEKYSYNDREELHKKEGGHAKAIKPSLNSFVPGRSQKEWIKDNKERHTEQQKQYRQANKEHRSQVGQLYYQNNEETIQQKQKQYREENKEKEFQRHKTYYQNKEKLLQKRKQHKEKTKKN